MRGTRGTRSRNFLLILTTGAALLGSGNSPTSASAPPPLTLSRSVIAAGGPTGAHGAARLRSTIGQAVTGRSSHAPQAVHLAGFWYRTPDTFTSIAEGDGHTPGLAARGPILRHVTSAPNPFTTSTHIRFDLARASRVRLRILGVDGRVVATPGEFGVPQGTHFLSFEPRGLPSGVYFYRLEAGREVVTGRLVLVR